MLDETSCRNILIYDVQKFDWHKRFIWDLDGTNYLVLFGLKKYDAIYDRIRYLMGLKSGITFFFSYNYPKI